MGPSEQAQAGDTLARARESTEALSIALLGPPYVGKTTLFDLLAGLSQRVNLRPGTTVEVRSGYYRRDGRWLEIVDLPAVYSLSASSPDEQVARDHIVKERPDVVVVMLSATNLEHGLYLVAEALELAAPVVVAINMMDAALRDGIRIEESVLRAALGVPVVAMVASRREGVQPLLEAIAGVAEGTIPYSPNPPALGPELASLLDGVEGLLGETGIPPYPRRWCAIKLLEGDREMEQLAQATLPEDRWEELHSLLHQNEDAVVAIASARYEWIDRTVRAALFRPLHDSLSLTERLDQVATHPYLGPLALGAVLALFFWLVYQVGEPLVGLLNDGVAEGSHRLRFALQGAPPWLVELLANGILGGVGTVVSLLPILAIFFLGMSALRQVGYMARAAFVADRFMRAMGLHGLSLVPLFLGFGCNVSSVLGARQVDSERARLLTILLAPLVPCSGRMVLLVFIAGLLYGGAAPLVIWGLVAMNLLLLALTGVLLDRTVLRSERPALIMELPPYRLPNWRAMAFETWQNAKEFAVRAGTVILVFSLLIWALADLPTGSMEESYLAQAGRHMEPLGRLMGLDWRMMVALLTSFLARKESALATLGILAAGGSESSLSVALPQMLTPASALAYLVVQMTFVPCASTLAAVLHQTRSWRWTAFGLGYQLALSLVVGIATYQTAHMLGWGL